MIRRLLTVLLFLLPMMPAKSEETRGLFEKQITLTIKVPYLLILPDGYQADQTYPLLLCLHGSGECGDDLKGVTKNGPFAKIKERKLPLIVLAPQCPPNQWWDALALEKLLDEIVAKYPVDKSRVYLTGLSLGGYGVWSLGLTRPERFAALVPICGGGEPGNVTPGVKYPPIWAFHGALDDIVPPIESERMVEALKKIGAEVRLTIVPEAGHACWDKVYEDPAFFPWLLAQKRTQ